MIPFNFIDVVTSLFSFFLYGLAFSLLITIFNLCLSLPEIIFRILKNESFATIYSDFIKTSGSLSIFISIISFSFGFLLISYLSVDGLIRIYFLLMSIISVWISKKIFAKLFLRLFYIFIRVIRWPITKLWGKNK